MCSNRGSSLPANLRRFSDLRLVRKGGFEPPRSCERQPLKLVRLPVPPLSRGLFRLKAEATRSVLPDLFRLLRGRGRLRGCLLRRS
jgi:hypothetical protein